jgi:hypothetical protein
MLIGLNEKGTKKWMTQFVGLFVVYRKAHWYSTNTNTLYRSILYIEGIFSFWYVSVSDNIIDENTYNYSI